MGLLIVGKFFGPRSHVPAGTRSAEHSRTGKKAILNQFSEIFPKTYGTKYAPGSHFLNRNS